MRKGRLLDLFCGAGGSAVGYARAGFEVVGVDIAPQPHYPFEFHQGDAMTWPLEGYDAIHASPPCQGYTTMGNRFRGRGGPEHPMLIAEVRERLRGSGVLYVIENVVGAQPQMQNPVLLAGSMFGLGVHRPRLFESSVLILVPGRGSNPLARIGVYGDRPDGRRLFNRADGTIQRAAASLAEAQQAMGMDWADWHGTKEAVPPAYTEFIGAQLLAALENERGAA
jgi:DNA (cytosine-5)-methyltransferase 1